MHNQEKIFFGIWILMLYFLVPSAQSTPLLDSAFGLDGRVAVELGAHNSAHAVAVQPDGKIIVAGFSSKGEVRHFSLLRFNSDGSLDTSFNGEGSVITAISQSDSEILALGLLSDGRIIAAGYSFNGTDRDFALACYLPDGLLDRTFGENGVVITPIGSGNEEISALTINAEDMITVAGTTEGTNGQALAVARYTSDGLLDGDFGDRGVALVGVGKWSTAEGILERRDGSLVVSGSYGGALSSSMMLVGLTADGFLDLQFGKKGIALPSSGNAASEGYGIAEDNEGRLYVAGSVGNPGQRDAALFRFARTGKVDTSFGVQGVLATPASEEDDVLYAVKAGKEGVAASGFTTEAGTRQFLVLTMDQQGGVTQAQASAAAIPTLQKAGVKSMPFQEVRMAGNSKVQIRRLKISTSFAEETTAQTSRSASFTKNVAQLRQGRRVPVQAHLSFRSRPWISPALLRFGNFFLPSAVAADKGGAVSKAAPVTAQFIATAFSEGEAVGYATALDASGKIIVVGTAVQADTSSIVVAQYHPRMPAGSVDDPAKGQNGFIAAAPPSEITRTSAVIVGEIRPSLGGEVVKRGVVFSAGKEPVYTGLAAVRENTVSLQPLLAEQVFEGLSRLLVADAVAATVDSPAKGNNGFVEEGETANGSGFGSFFARLDGLKPATTYLARVYAITSEGSVYYGNLMRFRTADACFIATASFGTILHPGVRILRNFRDTFLVKTSLGRQSVELYYRYSPPVADFVASHAGVRFAVRFALLPLIGFSWIALQLGVAAAVWLCVGLAAGSYFCIAGRRKNRCRSRNGKGQIVPSQTLRVE